MRDSIDFILFICRYWKADDNNGAYIIAELFMARKACIRVISGSLFGADASAANTECWLEYAVS